MDEATRRKRIKPTRSPMKRLHEPIQLLLPKRPPSFLDLLSTRRRRYLPAFFLLLLLPTIFPIACLGLGATTATTRNPRLHLSSMLKSGRGFTSTVTQLRMSTSAAAASSPSSVGQRQPRVAIVGGGAAGLACAKAFQDKYKGAGDVVLFEKDPAGGGIWRYVPNSGTRPMYRGLRTNLPKEIMQYREFPWTSTSAPTTASDSSTKERSFVTHEQVCDYLTRYREQYDLDRCIRWNTCVDQLTVLTDLTQPSKLKPEWPQIQIDCTTTISAAEDGQKQQTKKSSEVFDAVCVCNGHYSLPVIPDIPGLDENFKGKTLHSIAYDDPSEYEGQSVLCIGGRASGSDLAREISHFASRVYLSDTTKDSGQAEEQYNVTWVPKTVQVLSDGKIQFDHGCNVTPHVDTIIMCTGYEYSFPFINDQSNLPLELGGRRVAPLYKQLWHAEIPNVAFIGLPHTVLPFPFFELQAAACESQWTGAGKDFPSPSKMLEEAELDARSGGYGKENGRVPEDTHYLGAAQWDYCRDMAKLAGIYDDQLEDYLQTNKVSFII